MAEKYEDILDAVVGASAEEYVTQQDRLQRIPDLTPTEAHELSRKLETVWNKNILQPPETMTQGEQ